METHTHTHTQGLGQHLRERYTAPYLFQKTKTEGPNHPCVRLLAGPHRWQHVALPAWSHLQGRDRETGREGDRSREGGSMGVGMGKGGIWGRGGTASRLKQKTCSSVHKTFFLIE